MINPNMDRWIFASVGKHFDALKGDYHLHIDGQERTYDRKQSWVELRIIGPTPIIRTLNQTDYQLSVLLWCNTVMDYEDAHLMRRVSGYFLSIIGGPIKVYKLGKDPIIDDKSYIGCFVLRSDVDRPIDRIDYGQLKGEDKIQQTALEAQFAME